MQWKCIKTFKAKHSEIKSYPLCLGNISKEFQSIIWRKTGLKESVKVFSADYNTINTRDILDIHRFLMKKRYKKNFFFELLEKCLLYL